MSKRMPAKSYNEYLSDDFAVSWSWLVSRSWGGKFHVLATTTRIPKEVSQLILLSYGSLSWLESISLSGLF